MLVLIIINPCEVMSPGITEEDSKKIMKGNSRRAERQGVLPGCGAETSYERGLKEVLIDSVSVLGSSTVYVSCIHFAYNSVNNNNSQLCNFWMHTPFLKRLFAFTPLL